MGASDSQTEMASERVPGFLYLDMERVRSIASRMDEGIVEEMVEAEEDEFQWANRFTASVKATLYGIGGFAAQNETEVGETNTEISEETKSLHHYSYTLLEEWLDGAETGWFHDVDTILEEYERQPNVAQGGVRDRIEEGDIIRVTGDLDLLDFQTSLEFANGIFEGFDNFEQKVEDLDIDERLKAEYDLGEITEINSAEMELISLIFDLFEDMMPEEYRNMVAAEIRAQNEHPEPSFWGLVESEKLNSNPAELLSKYQSSSVPDCTVLARVETITTSEGGTQPDEMDDLSLGSFHHFTDDIAAEFGFKVSHPSIGISPIAIYR
ncbi:MULTISPECIES: DUF6414 family protein [Halococcus]|uniref:Uncharacterized protein n=1 Tax=Halococcus salifodinae DSM 8989 TaxID=1227456 RepID=M0MXN3_9EURY|nr:MULTISPECIES: hypothetical protein [Halococcus]EMA49190.1 hypothetical protein C450_18043 [Halococcus salifodinae DSM 8989]